MNRIRRVDNGFQVLVTQRYISNPSFELMLGNWTDEKMRNYRVVQFSTLQDAMDLAFKLPPIDWNKLISLHEDAFRTIVSTLNSSLKNGGCIVEIDAHIMNPTELKEIMFERVSRDGKRFNLFYDANDIISVNIINPWTNNLIKIVNTLKNIPDLRIKKIIKTKTNIKLIGLTDVNTVYEIRLWTSIMAQHVKWIFENELKKQFYLNSFDGIIAKQKLIDDSDIVVR